MQRLVPCLCFNDRAEEAVNFYVSLFKNSKILNVTYYTEKEIEFLAHLPEDIRPGPAGKVQTISFLLLGQEMMAANAGPSFTFNEGVSLMVKCDTQDEIDMLWDKLSAGGEIQECGWLRDRFGLSWQIVPGLLDQMMHDPDKAKAERAILMIYKMKKMDIKTLQDAYEGK